jgi:predicted dehydrogenase
VTHPFSSSPLLFSGLLSWLTGTHLTRARWYADSTEAINSPDVDAVLIATDTATHATLAIQALQAGKVSGFGWSLERSTRTDPPQHVLLEKPISVDVKKAIPVVEAAAAHPHLKTMIGFSRRCEWFG